VNGGSRLIDGRVLEGGHVVVSCFLPARGQLQLAIQVNGIFQLAVRASWK